MPVYIFFAPTLLSPTKSMHVLVDMVDCCCFGEHLADLLLASLLLLLLVAGSCLPLLLLEDNVPLEGCEEYILSEISQAPISYIQSSEKKE